MVLPSVGFAGSAVAALTGRRLANGLWLASLVGPPGLFAAHAASTLHLDVRGDRAW